MNVFFSLPRAAPAVLFAMLTGCASTVPAPVLLTLPPVAPLESGAASAVPAAAPGAAAAAASAPLLAVRRVAIPEYMVARRVRFRADASTLAEWPNTYWAERIEIGVSREFVAALRQQLPGWSICDTSCGDSASALTLQVDLMPLDYLRSAQLLRSRARIALFGAGAAPQLLQAQEFAYELPSGGDSAQAQAQVMSRLIEQVAAAAAPMLRSARR